MIKTITITIEHDTDFPGEMLISLKHGASGCMDYGVQQADGDALETLMTACYEALALVEDYDAKENEHENA